ELPQDETLFIQVFGYGGGAGAFDLCVADLGTIRLDSSELPIVSLFTQGQEIPYDGKVDALMEIRYNGAGNITYITDPPNVYAGDIGIGIRGATSAGYPQRPFAIETRDSSGANLDVSILGMPEENDWVLLSNYNDRSLVRNELAYELARRMGQYAPRTHLCEVLLDSSYRGIYVFGGKIKRDGGRVDIAKLTGDENTGDDVTGGYILSQNLWEPSTSFESNYSPIDHPGFDVHFVYEYPDPDTITTPQRTYIAAYVDSLETALYGADFTDPVNGYRKYLDVPSFINYFLVNELSRNNDGFKKSVYFHKDKYSNGGKLKAGPVWDFDWAWKNLYGCDIFDNIDGSGWAHLINDCPTDNYSCGWYVRLLQDSSFANELHCTYEAQRAAALSTESIFAYIDSVGARVQNAQARHFQKWPLLGLSGPAPEVLACATTYNAELDTLKGWIAQRLAWLDANMPGLCSQESVSENAGATALTCYPNPTTGLV
ncbi:MAG TPA: CotH kinase family protein, partial [Flavobacteriales bacterium]|nr:CotH kinase family protein [Flavobacteriales bacterium]